MTKKQYPEIRFKHPWLLMNYLDPVLRPDYAKANDEDLLSDEFILERLDQHEKAWRPYEKRILKAMCETFELEFYQNTIDIYVAPFVYSFSDPMTISTKYSPERVVDVITHELLHRLLTDNTTYPDKGLVQKWEKMFGNDHSKNTLVHIPVHAGLKAIFIDHLNEPERVDYDIAFSQKHEHYKLAWEYVETHGYKEIIEKIKQRPATK